MAIRLVIADSTSLHCELLADAVRRDHCIEVVGSVSIARDLLDLASKIVFDVALIALPVDDIASGRFDLVRELRQRSPEVRNIVMLDTSRREVVIEALRAGARGVFPKNGTLKMLCKCVRRVYEGQIWATSTELAATLDAVAASHEIRAVDSKKQDLLSKREREVVSAVAEGLTNREIGERLGLSRHTVKNYLLHVFDKLGVSNRIELLFLSLSQTTAAGNGAAMPLAEEPPSGLRDVLNGASMRSPDALLKLGSCFREGLFVPRSLVSAYMWCVVAERSSHLFASQSAAKKQELSAFLSPEEIAQAERDAQFWRSHLDAIGISVTAKVQTMPQSIATLEASA